ncbi:MAG: hypothetical protein M1830_006251 [Pleopsidium flavum]|nr:MAG: hypothetical protein M1830_006251 [Pleopsidium flavum]
MLQGAIRDVNTGVLGDHGYGSIFKDSASVQFVRQRFEDITNGIPMLVHTNQGSEGRSPTIVCVKPGETDLNMNRFLIQCAERTPVRPHVIAVPGSQFVVLCQNFFSLKPLPEASDCPTVTSAGTFIAPGLIVNQYAALVRQLAHFFLGPFDLQPEVLDLDDIIRLDADASKRNAKSYGLYAASVQAGCTIPGTPHHRPVPD